MASSWDSDLTVLMCGTGEYTTGYTGGDADSDKKAGVVGVCMCTSAQSPQRCTARRF